MHAVFADGPVDYACFQRALLEAHPAITLGLLFSCSAPDKKQSGPADWLPCNIDRVLISNGRKTYAAFQSAYASNLCPPKCESESATFPHATYPVSLSNDGGAVGLTSRPFWFGKRDERSRIVLGKRMQ